MSEKRTQQAGSCREEGPAGELGSQSAAGPPRLLRVQTSGPRCSPWGSHAIPGARLARRGRCTCNRVANQAYSTISQVRPGRIRRVILPTVAMRSSASRSAALWVGMPSRFDISTTLSIVS